MRIFHIENDPWIPISNENDINMLHKNYDFNHTWIDEINFVRSRHILYIDDENKGGCRIRIPDAMILSFNSYVDLTKATTKRIEILFANLDKMNFRPEDKHDLEFLDTVLMKFSDGYLYFGDTVGYEKDNEYGYPDDATWLRCEKAFWRKIDYSVDV